MKIRKATSKDVNELCGLLEHLFDQEKEHKADKKKQKKGLKSIITQKKVGQIFVATKKDKVIAMISLLYSVSTALGGKVGIIEDVVVSPKQRGKEVGSKLIKHVIQYADKKKLKRLTLFTDLDNEKAHKFYKEAGFNRSTMVQFQRSIA